jgi:hypothetical protein
MKYFKYLDLDWQPVSEKLKQFILTNKELVNYNQSGWNRIPINHILDIFPNVIKMLKPLNVIPYNISILISYGNSDIIHRDYGNQNRRVVLPILNCENSVTRFYKSNQPHVLKQQNNGVPYYIVENPELCEVVSEYKLTRPVTLRINELHCIHADSINLPRISCPINVNKDLDYLLE